MTETPGTTWKLAVLSALQNYSVRHKTLQVERKVFIEEELPNMVRSSGSAGRTPAQTVSRILQELRDERKIFFSAAGVYVIGGKLNVESEDFPDDALENAAKSETLFFGDVETDEAIGQARLRRGMLAVRRATLQNYFGCCALYDVRDERLLVAAHIARWADHPEARGKLSNILCLCRIHDPLFELGYMALTDDRKVIWHSGISSETIRVLAKKCTSQFHTPLWQAPATHYLRAHRERVGLSR